MNVVASHLDKIIIQKMMSCANRGNVFGMSARNSKEMSYSVQAFLFIAFCGKNIE